ncbi:PREDICTED: defensin-like protein 289 [Camelina sativa]|uniref:Defensin-like protein 289 n=1 Tax=Camelina sativa TaxID=90675 RepID=A0ABM0X1A3_CAMSA|nr:PREDICTED: defensin-like protein 289 [Camelina sativa]
MAASKTTIFIIFVLCLSCTLLANIIGVQADDISCKTTKECVVQCSEEDAKCIDRKCHCPHPTVEIEPTNKRCKKDSDCPSTHPCPKDYYYACVTGECTCIAV